MIHSDFVHLHNHTAYSLLDGASHIDALVEKAVEYKMPALAITDHGNMFGVVEFYNKCMSSGIKPIVGCELYVAPSGRFDKQSSHGIRDASYHLLVLCKDETGYKNLCILTSLGYREGFYYRPRVDKEILSKYSEGLIAMTACVGGEIPHYILRSYNEPQKKIAPEAMPVLKEKILEYQRIFGKDNFFLEIQDNGLDSQKIVNSCLVEMSQETGIPLVITNDSHYVNREDALMQDVLLCIGTQKLLDDKERLKFRTDEFYFRSPAEMKTLSQEYPSAYENAVKIAERCNFAFGKHAGHLPEYDVPQGYSIDSYLEHLCREGLTRRYGDVSKEIEDRFRIEYNVIKKMGYSNYFLLIWDFVKYARDNGISIGPGRGSAVGCIISYALGITNVDPIKFGLLFERFLNIDRKGLPDVDIDIEDKKREKVIEHIRNKYGTDNVAYIITFGMIRGKSAVRDVGRVMNIPLAECDRIAKLIPNSIAKEDIEKYKDYNIIDYSIQRAPEIKKIYEENNEKSTMLKTAAAIQEIPRHSSKHAAGLVISKFPLMNILPLYEDRKGNVCTQYDMDSLANVGVLKMDLLGLAMLTVIDNCVALIKQEKGIETDLEKITLDDANTYKLLSEGHSVGVFQLESDGMRNMLRNLKPTNIYDIIASCALYRPGPLESGMVDEFIKRKNNIIPVNYPHPLLEDILKETYGVIVYQEQVMKIAEVLAGFSLGQADTLRAAMSKKKKDVIDKIRTDFIDGCVKNKVNKNLAEEIYTQMEYFGYYGFNKSHSAAYGILAYRTAYLKANYPVEFMTALLTANMSKTDELSKYITEARVMGITILPADVNESSYEFTMEKGAVRFGMGAIKNVGEGTINSIVEQRKKERFKSIYDFCEKIDFKGANRRVVESLIKCGAFDSLGAKRAQLLKTVDSAIEGAATVQQDKKLGQASLFEIMSKSGEEMSMYPELPDVAEFGMQEKLQYEKEILGFYFQGHPLVIYEDVIKRYANTSLSEIPKLPDGREVHICGMVKRVRVFKSLRDSANAANVRFEDLSGETDVKVWSEEYQKYSQYLTDDSLLFIRGRVSVREDRDRVGINAMEIVPLSMVQEKYTTEIHIKLSSVGLTEETLFELNNKLRSYHGRTSVFIHIAFPKKGEITLKSNDIGTKPCGDLIGHLKETFGEDSFWFVDSLTNSRSTNTVF